MVTLATSKNRVVVCNEYVLSIDSLKNEHNITECRSFVNSNVNTATTSINNGPVSVDCASLSSCGKFLAVCCNKKIMLLNVDQWFVISVRELPRIANSVKFTPSGNQIVVADRSGDAYMYSVGNPNLPADLLLGHTSMLIDILVTANEKFVITCDRDEKIRVSNFPNAYNIHSFCLGHEKFVSCIAEMPHDVSTLVSGSGDGTIRFWDYLSGTELYVVSDNFSRNLSVREQQKILETNHIQSCKSNSHSEGESLPIRCFSWLEKDSDSSIGCVCVGSLSYCFIFCASSRGKDMKVSMVQEITLQSEPWVASFSDSGVLWVLQQVKGKTSCAFMLNAATNFFDELCGSNTDVEYVLSIINNKWDIFSNQEAPKVLSILYKRIFDDVQEYHDRKKARLFSASKNV